MQDTEKAIKLVKYLIREHENENLCTKMSEAEAVIPKEIKADLGLYKLYELGRYETLVDLLNTLEKIAE